MSGPLAETNKKNTVDLVSFLRRVLLQARPRPCPEAPPAPGLPGPRRP